MSDPEPAFDEVDPEEWKKNLEHSLKYEFSDRPLADKIQFVKKMADALKLTLDDIRGKNESAKYCALNSIPPDVIPIDIKLTDGHRIILMMVNPVATCYEDFLTDVRGDVVHIFVRRKGEELPEDFLPPRRIINVSPPPPGFVRSSVFRRRVVIPSVDRNDAAESRPCQSELKPGTSEPGPSTSEPKPSTSELGPSTSEPGPSTSVPGPSTSVSGPSTLVPGPSTFVPGLSKSVDGCNTSDTLELETGTPELGPGASEPEPSSAEPRLGTSKEFAVLAKKDDLYEEGSTYGITKDSHSIPDEIRMEEMTHNATVEYTSTDKDRGYLEFISTINEGDTLISIPGTCKSELDPVAAQPEPSFSKEIVTPMDEKHKEKSTYGIIEYQHSLTDEILVEEVAHNVIIEYNSTDKYQEESAPDIRKEETTICKKNQEKSMPIISYGEDTPIDESYKKELTLDMWEEETSDEEHQKESILDTSEEDEDTPDSKEIDSPYDEKDLDESIPSTLDVSIPSTVDVSIPSTGDDLSDTKSIDLELYPCIEIDNLSSNSGFSNKIQVVGLIDPDIINEVEPEVELQAEESSHVENDVVIFVPQENEELPSTSSPIKRKRGRPRKCDRNSVAHNTATEDYVNTSLRRVKTRLSSRGNRGKTSVTSSQRSDTKNNSLLKNKKLMALAQNSQESCSASPKRKKQNLGSARKIMKS